MSARALMCAVRVCVRVKRLGRFRKRGLIYRCRRRGLRVHVPPYCMYVIHIAYRAVHAVCLTTWTIISNFPRIRKRAMPPKTARRGTTLRTHDFWYRFGYESPSHNQAFEQGGPRISVLTTWLSILKCVAHLDSA